MPASVSPLSVPSPTPSVGNAPTLADLTALLVGDIALVLSERPGMSEARKAAHARLIAGMILALAPRDAVQLMLAGQYVLFHELLLDTARDAVRAEGQATVPAALRRSMTATTRLMLSLLRELRLRQKSVPLPPENEADRERAERPQATDPRSTERSRRRTCPASPP